MNQHAALGCPRCSGFLRKKAMRKLNHPSGAVLDVCDGCGGMWLDANEVKLLHSHSAGNSGKARSKR